MTNVDQWSKTADDNTDTSPAGAQVGWQGADVGPLARAIMAGVREWADNPEWFSVLKDAPTSGTSKGITRYSPNTGSGEDGYFKIADTTSATKDYFPVGARIQTRRTTGIKTYHFVSKAEYDSGFTKVFVTPWNETTDGTGTGGGVVSSPAQPFTNDGIDLFVARPGDDTTANTSTGSIGSIAFGGGGSTTLRDAKYVTGAPNTPGVVWVNTSTDNVEASIGGAWVVIGHASAFSDNGGSITLDSTTSPKVSLSISGTERARLERTTSDTKLIAYDNEDPQVATGTIRQEEATGLIYSTPKGSEVTTTLSAAITDAAATTIPITSASSFSSAGTVTIGSEAILYDAKVGDSLIECTRGALGTTAATHDDAATVTQGGESPLTSVNGALLEGRTFANVKSFVDNNPALSQIVPTKEDGSGDWLSTSFIESSGSAGESATPRFQQVYGWSNVPITGADGATPFIVEVQVFMEAKKTYEGTSSGQQDGGVEFIVGLGQTVYTEGENTLVTRPSSPDTLIIDSDFVTTESCGFSPYYTYTKTSGTLVATKSDPCVIVPAAGDTLTVWLKVTRDGSSSTESWVDARMSGVGYTVSGVDYAYKGVVSKMKITRMAPIA